MNRWFVNVKVDREERPELDEIYMTATQLLTGRGGWPNSVFLTPELEPFFAGTYFPPRALENLPGFPRVLEGVHAAWEQRREQVVEQAGRVTAALNRALSGSPEGSAPPEAKAAGRALEALVASYDEEWGGFGEQQKFPRPASLRLLWESAPRRAVSSTRHQGTWGSASPAVRSTGVPAKKPGPTAASVAGAGTVIPSPPSASRDAAGAPRSGPGSTPAREAA